MLKQGSNGFHGMFTRLNSLKPLVLYSTSVASKDAITNPLTIDFLVKSVGFSELEAISIATRAKVSKYVITSKKSKLVVDYLNENGFDVAQIRKVIACIPSVLSRNVEKTLKPKIRAFEDLGLSGSNLGLIISQHPDMLSKSVESGIVPVIVMLKSLFGSNDHLVRSLLQIRPQRVFSSTACKNLPANLLLMQSYGLTGEQIKWLMLHSSVLFLSTERAAKIVEGVEDKLGIPQTSGMFVYGIHVLSSKSEERMESWRGVFRSYGWSETDISKLLKRNPLCLGLSDELVRFKLKYLMEDLGLESDYLARRPEFLAYSMEKRISPRVAVRQTLMDRNLLKRQIGVYTLVKMPISKFMTRFVLPYKEALPQLYEDFTQATDYYKT